MAEGEDSKPRAQSTLPPPSRAEHAARKLGLRPVPTVPPKSNPALGAQGTRPSLQPAASSLPPSSPRGQQAPPKGEATQRGDAVYAARRSMISGEAPAAEPESTPKPAKPAKRSPVVMAGAALAILAIVVFGALTAVRMIREGSDEGRVRARLVDAELAGRDVGARENAFGEIDKMPKGPQVAVDLLTDPQKAERGSSHSTHTIQDVAHQYLLHLAATKKAEPPAKATELSKTIFAGGTPSADQWKAVQQAWRTWLDTKK